MVEESWWYTEFRDQIRNASDEELPRLYDKLYDEYLYSKKEHMHHEKTVPIQIDGKWMKISDIGNSYRFIRFLIKQFKDEGKILELGCGTSSFAYIIVTDGYEVTATDIRQKVIDNHRKHIKLLSPKYREMIRFDCAFAEVLPYHDESFDIIVGVDLIEHIRTPARLISECKRVLKLDGKMYFSTPTEGIHWSPEHLHNFRRKNLEKTFDDFKLKSKFYVERHSWKYFEPNTIIAEVWK